MTNERLIQLINVWLEETISPADKAALQEALQEEANAEQAKTLIQQHLEQRAYAYEGNLDNLFAGIEARIHETPVRRVGWIRWAAAAVILFAVAGTWFLLDHNRTSSANTTITAKADIPAPQLNRSRITIGNGKTIYLDSLHNGQTLTIDGVQLTKLADGKIAYEATAGTAVVYNTASNPRGSKVMDLELSDHTHVWLNAGSSVTYPVAFTGSTREVKMDGEAYFEVAHNAKQPFVVAKGDTKVQVLGTHFNVKAYTTEPNLKVTLLQGSVNVASATNKQLLKPGQQAVITNNNIQLVAEADTEEAMAWKNGMTSFHGAKLNTVLNEIGRWYDIEVDNQLNAGAYEGISFYVDVQRSVSLDVMLGSVLKDRNINYLFDDKSKKLTILPK